jgi:hypothetical protein
MATTFIKDQTVRLKVMVPQGPIDALRMDEDGTVFYRVSWVDAAGNAQSRWFAENELEAV